MLAAGASAVALFVPWLPPSAARQAGRIDFVFWFVTGISIFIFSVTNAVLLYSIVRFRVPAEDEGDGPPIHGHTVLEAVWTAIPAALVAAISIVSSVVLARNDHLPARHLTVDVTGRQFAWTFAYPAAGNLSAPVLRLPLGEPALLRLHSLDVIHAFWVPQFRESQDAVPGSVERLIVTPDRLGTYPVICSELCGLGHALMRSEAIVMRPAAFRAWLAARRRSPGGTPLAGGKPVFLSNGCGSCHTLGGVGATGTVGPDLDRLPAEARRAGQPLVSFIRRSIVDPNAYIEPGYPRNVMPQTFGQLPKDQLEALVQFLVAAAGRGRVGR